MGRSLRVSWTRTGRPGPSTWEAGDYPEGQDDYPVSGVSWYEAAAYAEFAGKALPTVDHWGARRASRRMRSPSSTSRSTLTLVEQLRERTCSRRQHAGHELLRDVRHAGERPGVVLQRIRRTAARSAAWAWNDARYNYDLVAEVPPFDRDPSNGFRCARYLDPDGIPAAAFEPFAGYPASRDYLPETARLGRSLHRSSWTVSPTTQRISTSAPTETTTRPRLDPGEGEHRRRLRRRAASDIPLHSEARPPAVPGRRLLPRLRPVHDARGTAEQLRARACSTSSSRAGGSSFSRSTRGRWSETTRNRLGPRSDETLATRRCADYMIKVVKDFTQSARLPRDAETSTARRSASTASAKAGSGRPSSLAVGGTGDSRPGSVTWAGFTTAAQLPVADPFNYVTRVNVPVLMLNGRYDTNLTLKEDVEPMFRLLGTSGEGQEAHPVRDGPLHPEERTDQGDPRLARQVPRAGPLAVRRPSETQLEPQARGRRRRVRRHLPYVGFGLIWLPFSSIRSSGSGRSRPASRC